MSDLRLCPVWGMSLKQVSLQYMNNKSLRNEPKALLIHEYFFVANPLLTQHCRVGGELLAAPPLKMIGLFNKFEVLITVVYTNIKWN